MAADDSADYPPSSPADSIQALDESQNKRDGRSTHLRSSSSLSHRPRLGEVTTLSSSPLRRTRSQFLRDPTTTTSTPTTATSSSPSSILPVSRQMPSLMGLRRSVSQSFRSRVRSSEPEVEEESPEYGDDGEDRLNLRHHQKHLQQQLYQSQLAKQRDRAAAHQHQRDRSRSITGDELSEEAENDEDSTVIIESNVLSRPGRRMFSAETVTPESSAADSSNMWAAIDDLRARVRKLETSADQNPEKRFYMQRAHDSASSLSGTNNGYLRAMLQQAGGAIPEDLCSALDVTASAVEALSARVATSDRNIKAKMDALYRSLTELFIVVSDTSSTPPSSAAQPAAPNSDLRSGSSVSNRSDSSEVRSLAARLPQRAATRMRHSIETSQLPPDLRPASRMASRASSYDYAGDDEDISVLSSSSSASGVTGSNRHLSLLNNGTRQHARKMHRSSSRQQLTMSDELDYGMQQQQQQQRPHSIFSMRSTPSSTGGLSSPASSRARVT
ncbi:hypothetical protein BZA70DRAFT_274513 [Myxozyma melibiosi]|uniref:Uncharacterized protein n=1 Tax=Myxozyma melibiosi TaxID=54550 RepID=A0ABR1F9L8_9ASCO